MKVNIGGKKWIMLFIAIIFVAALSTLGYNIWAQQQDQEDEPVYSVSVAEAKKQDLTRALRTSGVMESKEIQTVQAEATAIVREIRKAEGSKVMLGEVILLMDNSEVLAELGKLENNLAVLENDYLQAVSDKVFLMEKRDDARNSLERLEELYQLGTVNYDDLENARADAIQWENRVLAINLNALQDAVNRGRIAVEAARDKLTATVVTSPLEGTIINMNVRSGQTVRQGETYFTIGNNDLPEVIVVLPAEDALPVQNGMAVNIYAEKYPEKVFKGRASLLATTDLPVEAEAVIAATGEQNAAKEPEMVKVKITALEDTEELLPGLPVDVEFIFAHKPQVLTVPSQAVVQVDGKSVVLVFDDGVAKTKEVECGLASEDLLEIISGIKENDKVIISLLEQIIDGTKVKIESK